jgi:predicted small lipoprotein YifL
MRRKSRVGIGLLLIAVVSFTGCGRKNEENTAPVSLAKPAQEETVSSE